MGIQLEEIVEDDIAKACFGQEELRSIELSHIFKSDSTTRTNARVKERAADAVKSDYMSIDFQAFKGI